MPVDQRQTVWDRNWAQQAQTVPEAILNSSFTQKAYRCIKSFIRNDDKLILEAGCGTGRLCWLLGKDFPDTQVLGIDISPNSLNIAEKLKEYLQSKNVSFAIGDLFKIPYPDDYFDVVFNDGVIEHFPLEEYPNYKDALKEMIRITKPGGKIIVDVPNWFCFPHTIYKWILEKVGKDFEYGYEKSFKHRELMELFREFNLIDLELRGYYSAHGFYRLNKNILLFSLCWVR